MTSPRWPRYGAALVGLSWFLALGGGPTLNPVNIGWLLAGDWRQHWLGWLFFRRDPWAFPLGTIASLPYPVGTTIGFTDSNPLVSLLLKPFSGVLPDEFQFIGPWLAVCFMLQGYFGAALAGTVSRRGAHQWLGGSLFALSPVLAARVGHDTLCAHWLLLGLMYLGLRDCAGGRDARRGAWLAAAAPVLAAAVHPYLAAMSWTLAQAVLAKKWRAGLIAPGRAAAMAAVATGGLFAVLGAVGYFGAAGVSSPGFGKYSADLAALIDPREYSQMLPALPLSGDQWEGYGFVGLGGLIAGAVALVAWIRARPSLGADSAWIVAACLLMGIYALSSTVTAAGSPVVDLGWLYAPLTAITGPFRASGRFVWPLHYLVLLGAIWGTTRIARSSRLPFATVVLAAAVVAQALDFKPEPPPFADKHFRQAPIGDFAIARGYYRHVAIYPMQVLGACGNRYEEDHVYRFMLEAYRLKTTFNSGIFARLPVERTQQACGDLYRAVEAGRLDPRTIYVVSPDAVPRMKDAGAACGRFDGDWICVSRDSDPAFRAYLDAGRTP